MQLIRAKILGVYDLFLAAGAIWFGIKMVMSNSGIFTEHFPQSWANNLPFTSWVMPGILAIIIFGIGNIAAALLSFKIKHNSSWYASMIMGFIFFLGLVFQKFIVNEHYIVTNPFLALGLVQILLSVYVFLGYANATINKGKIKK